MTIQTAVLELWQMGQPKLQGSSEAKKKLKKQELVVVVVGKVEILTRSFLCIFLLGWTWTLSSLWFLVGQLGLPPFGAWGNIASNRILSTSSTRNWMNRWMFINSKYQVPKPQTHGCLANIMSSNVVDHWIQQSSTICTKSLSLGIIFRWRLTCAQCQ